MKKKLLTLLASLFLVSCLDNVLTSSENSSIQGGFDNASDSMPTGLVLEGGSFQYNNGTVASSCAEYLDPDVYNNEGDALYTVDLDGDGPIPSFNAYCDMTRDGGGWMLALKTQTQQGAWFVQSASINEADCQSAAPGNNCSSINLYNWGGWSEMMGDNQTSGFISIIPKNPARTSLQNHFTGAELSDPNVYPFLIELYTGTIPTRTITHSEWNGTGDSGRIGAMLADQASVITALVGGRMNGSCRVNTVGNGYCFNSFASVFWFWLR